MICAKCGYNNKQDARYCEECSWKLSQSYKKERRFPKLGYLLVYIAFILTTVFVIFSYTNGNENNPVITEPTLPDQKKEFTHNPELLDPNNNKLKGVVELGAQGFNYFIIRMDSEKNWELDQAVYRDAFVLEKGMSPEEIVERLRFFIFDRMIKRKNLSAEDIHFVVSSGAAKSPEIVTITRDLKELGYVVNIVTKEEEGIYAAKCLLDETLEKEAFVLDIGSGNTKVAWMEGGEIMAKGTYGSKYYLNEDYDKEPVADYDRKVVQEAREIGGSVLPARTKTCFLIGGIAFDLAKQSREEKERYTVLKDLSEYKIEGEKMRCGVKILKGVIEGSRCEQLIFDWNANFTIGFLLALDY